MWVIQIRILIHFSRFNMNVFLDNTNLLRLFCVTANIKISSTYYNHIKIIPQLWYNKHTSYNITITLQQYSTPIYHHTALSCLLSSKTLRRKRFFFFYLFIKNCPETKSTWFRERILQNFRFKRINKKPCFNFWLNLLNQEVKLMQSITILVRHSIRSTFIHLSINNNYVVYPIHFFS